MKDVMIDLETLGTRYDAQIIQIGACYFDRITGEIGRGFSVNVRNDGIWADKFTVDYDTVKWWFAQDERARQLLMENPISLPASLQALSEFLGSGDVQLWSHATFDIPILMNAFNQASIKFPVPFRNMRDLRTLMDLYGEKVDLDREGTHHHALDDAKYQARYASVALMSLSHAKE